jgi:cardiolipin synthase
MLNATPTTMNLPNLLTIIRIVLVPVFLLLIFSNSFYAATIVFAVAGFTDLIDGIIARKLNSVTRFGANLDPVADKLLLSSAFIALSIKEFIPLWLAIIVVARDSIMITTIMILKYIKYAVNTSPMITGKLTTLFQVLSVLCALLFREIPGANLLYIFTGFITVLGAALYIFREFNTDA